MSTTTHCRHTAEKDIVRAGIDAWIIQFRGSLLDSAAEENFDTMYILRSRGFPFRDLIVDKGIITGFSIFFTVLVVKRILPSLSNRNWNR